MFKGLPLSFAIIIFMLVGVPLLITFSMLGPDDYARQCKTAITIPCFGISE